MGKINGGNGRRKVSNQKRKDSPILEEPKKDSKMQKIADDSNNEENTSATHEPKRKSVKDHARSFNQKFDHRYDNSQLTNSSNKVEMPEGPSFQERMQHFQSEETTFDFSSDDFSSAISENALSESELL